jgi:NAD(P)H-hydrate epimerase
MAGFRCSVKQMQEADRRAITVLGVPGCVLMYNAGRSITDVILARYPQSKLVGVLAGKGNNAGDGFVISHLLAQSGVASRVICLSPRDQYVGDALIYLNLCANEHLPLLFPATPDAMIEAARSLADCDLIVDAILGTGMRGPVREPIASVIAAIPSDVPVVAVDIPSGLNADTGEICGCCVRANVTVTLAAVKHGLVGHPEWTGDLVVGDIGMPQCCLIDEEWQKVAPLK